MSGTSRSTSPTRREKTSKTTTQLDLCLLLSRVGDIGHSELVRLVAGEFAVNKVSGRVLGHDPSVTPTMAGKALQASLSYRQLHGVITDCDPVTHRRFGVDPRCSVGASEAVWTWRIMSASRA